MRILSSWVIASRAHSLVGGRVLEGRTLLIISTAVCWSPAMKSVTKLLRQQSSRVAKLTARVPFPNPETADCSGDTANFYPRGGYPQGQIPHREVHKLRTDACGVLIAFSRRMQNP